MVVIQDLLLLLNEAVRRNPHGEAVVSLRQPHLGPPGVAIEKKPDQLRWTYSQLETGAKVLASCLRELGLQKGNAILFFCENCAEYGPFCWTAVYPDCPFVPLNPRATLSAEEVQHMLKQVCGLISAEDINRSVSVFAFVDSISAMRFSSTVKKRFQEDISVDDLTQCSTIQE